MELIEQHLGRVLKTKQVAELLKLSEKTVRDHYLDFGGIKIGRHYRFFERSIIDAIQKQTEEQVYSSVQAGKDQERESLQHNERGQGMGSRNEKNARQSLGRDEDRHNLL